MNPSNHNGKLSFVMPIALNEALTDDSLWRSQVNKDSIARFVLVLRSFIRMYDQADLDTFFLICPDEQCVTVREVVASVTCDPRYTVLAETSIIPSIADVLAANEDGLGGWYAQQIIKLAAHTLVRTPYYFVFDSDIVCIRPCNYESFVVDDRPLLNVEHEKDYAELYMPDFVQEEVCIKTKRRRASLAALGIDSSQVDCSIFYGETPVILSTAHVPLVLNRLEDVHRTDWVSVLCKQKGWTEFGLYFGYQDACNITDSVYRVTHSNVILDLGKSVWQLSSRYQQSRDYDFAHFFGTPSGYFVALQSWIPEGEWLPSRFPSVRAFYQEMAGWLEDAWPTGSRRKR